ncbi:MAG TPA: hypothetical protein VFJ74_17780 [Gemmatimonadaceae bacterium]|nr:hypothetical protein [Gemmatimonadaceae bacterium]
MAIVLVPRPEGLRPVRERSPLTGAFSLGTAGLLTALLFGVFTSIAPTGSLFARDTAGEARLAPSHANRVGMAVVLPAVRVVAPN